MGDKQIHIDLLKKLRDPFPPEDVEWRVQSCGISGTRAWVMVIPYITNRAIQNRLDEVFPFAWENVQRQTADGKGYLCGITIHIDGKELTRWDGAEFTNIEALKGALSNAMKRAGAQWGIGRYLYNMDEAFAVCAKKEKRNACIANAAKTKENEWIDWETPPLPKWALPSIGPGHFKEAMATTTDMEQLKEAFENACKYCKTSGTDEMLKDFTAEKDKEVDRITKLLESQKEVNLAAVTKWLNREVSNFARVSNVPAIDSVYKTIKTSLTLKCKGQAFESEPLHALLNESYTNRKNELGS
jgi:hypothetical protein